METKPPRPSSLDPLPLSVAEFNNAVAGGCSSPPSARLTPKALLYPTLSQSDRLARPLRPCHLVLRRCGPRWILDTAQDTLGAGSQVEAILATNVIKLGMPEKYRLERFPPGDQI